MLQVAALVLVYVPSLYFFISSFSHPFSIFRLSGLVSLLKQLEIQMTRCLLPRTLLLAKRMTRREICPPCLAILWTLLAKTHPPCVSPLHIFTSLFNLSGQAPNGCTDYSPSHLHEDRGGPSNSNNMDLGNSSYSIALLGISRLFLDKPEPTVPATEDAARPSSVRLPYALLPGMDTTSRAYQKATALLGQFVQDLVNSPPLPLGYTMTPAAIGNSIPCFP